MIPLLSIVFLRLVLMIILKNDLCLRVLLESIFYCWIKYIRLLRHMLVFINGVDL